MRIRNIITVSSQNWLKNRRSKYKFRWLYYLTNIRKINNGGSKLRIIKIKWKIRWNRLKSWRNVWYRLTNQKTS